MAGESWFWRWAARVAAHAPWIAKTWPAAFAAVSGVLAAYFAALQHLALWQVYLIGLYGLAAGVWLVAGIRIAYVKWSPWGQRAVGEVALHRRQLIEGWRAMVTEVNRTFQQQDKAGLDCDVAELLQGHPAFPSLRPHLSDEVRRGLDRMVGLNSDSILPAELDKTLQEIERLEREWRLFR